MNKCVLENDLYFVFVRFHRTSSINVTIGKVHYLCMNNKILLSTQPSKARHDNQGKCPWMTTMKTAIFLTIHPSICIPCPRIFRILIWWPSWPSWPSFHPLFWTSSTNIRSKLILQLYQIQSNENLIWYWY